MVLNLPDFITGAFEFVSGLFGLANIWRIYKDKALSGVSIIPVLFFEVWGVWNFYYYPHLDQWWAFAGGFGIFAVNIVWLGMVLYYRKIQ